MSNYGLGIIICLLGLYASLSIGVAIRLYSKKEPLLSAICIAPLVPINTIIINLIVSVYGNGEKENKLKTRIFKGLITTLKNFDYFLGINCVLISASKLKFSNALLLPFAFLSIGIDKNKKNKMINVKVYESYTNQIKYQMAIIG